MKKTARAAFVLVFLLSVHGAAARSQPPVQHATPDAGTLPTVVRKTAAMWHIAGLLPLDWDAKAGRLYLELALANGRSRDLLYTESLPYGVGSSDIGLDRGEISAGRIVHFERIGAKVLLVEPNQAFRSSSSDAAEQLSVEQSFPASVLFGFTVAAESPDGKTVLADATDFFVRDAHGVSKALADAKQGVYKVDPSRSAIDIGDTKGFPRNTEVEAILTFANDDPVDGGVAGKITPDPHAMTVREHQSFVELPGPGFTPRRFDPRAGYFMHSYRDYSAPLGAPLDQQFILRHRLIKKDPTCVSACVAVAPIQYYVDNGAPEPIRSALLEGARWWDQAFQAAGWAPGTFKVDILPAGADPMDVRYNIIQWVHRYTRGWSYGAAVADPRTGEIVKGNVTLGSLRGRQDYLIAEALLSPYVQGATITPANDPMLAMVLQRLRQLAAHETGHTLGLAHNFAASSYGTAEPNGTSVMDYPHPYIALSAGVPDLSHAYAVNIGAWDKVAIDYGYREFDNGGAPMEDHAALDKIITGSEQAGLVYLTDEDARPLGSASPRANLWDNGPDAADELNRILEVRAAALARFGENVIRPGAPMAQLEDTLVPLYLLHRYQTEAAAKEIGGLDYRYSLRGDGQPGPAIVANAAQNKAIAAVLKTLAPNTLTLPESLLAVLPPRPPGLEPTRESLPSETGLTFDPVAAAEAAADLTLRLLLDPARAMRIVEYHMRVAGSPSLRVLLESVSKTVAERTEGGHTMSSEVERAVEFRALEAMFALAVNPAASSQVRAIASSHIADVLKQISTAPPLSDSAEAIHRAALIERISQFERDPAKFVPAKPIEAPPGMPIGDDEDY
jgi:hypothetical protein